MPGNTLGSLFRLTTFGESHGAGIGGVLDGCPAGLALDLAQVQVELDRRRPGSTPLGTTRKEADQAEWLSGLFEGKSTGTPIAFLIRNADARPQDYDALKDVYRPSHADRTWEQKFGLRDHRGGGRSSARTMAAVVAGGAIARQLIATAGMRVSAYVDQVGDVQTGKPHTELDLARVYENDVRCPDPVAAELMTKAIEKVRAEGDSIGGAITLVAGGVPPGLGDPVFDKLHADLGKALLGINAVKGFEVGSGFSSIAMRGSQHNDAFVPVFSSLPPDGGGGRGGVKGNVATATNRSGGVQGGISNGEDIVCRIAFKPASTIAQQQRTVDKEGKEVVLQASGRHDPCVVPRAVPIVEAMACLVLADHLLRQRTSRI